MIRHSGTLFLMVLDQSMRLKQLKYEREHTHTHMCIALIHTVTHIHTHQIIVRKESGSAGRPALMGNFCAHVAYNFTILY